MCFVISFFLQPTCMLHYHFTIIICTDIAAPLSLFAIEPDSSSKQAMDGAIINTARSFECLWYINPTRTDIEPIAGTLFWRINLLETKEEIEFTSDVSGEDFIVSTLENGITLNILGNFLGSVSCIYGKDSISINVVTNGKNVSMYIIVKRVVVRTSTSNASFDPLMNQSQPEFFNLKCPPFCISLFSSGARCRLLSSHIP